MKPLKPKIAKEQSIFGWPLGDVEMPEGHILLEEKIPKEMKGRVDPEDWPGHFEISVWSYKVDKKRFWAVRFEQQQYTENQNQVEVKRLHSRKIAVEVGKVLVMAYLTGSYETECYRNKRIRRKQ